MARGGAQPGAGRPKGSLSARTQELVAIALAEGISPLEVMLKDMRFYDNLAENAVSQLEAASANKEKARMLKVVNEFKSKARECAKDAAPYTHPKLNAISGSDGGPIQVSLKVSFGTATSD